jgi:hypothetical protein
MVWIVCRATHDVACRSLIPAALFPVYQRDALTAQMRLDAFDEPVHIAIEVRVGSGPMRSM